MVVVITCDNAKVIFVPHYESLSLREALCKATEW